MKTPSVRSVIPSLIIVLLTGLFFLAPKTLAAPIVWSGAGGGDTNWSNGNNWVGLAAPAGADDVKFFDLGAVAAPLQPNNLVDASSGIGTLQFGQTNNHHTVSIASGQTLYVTNGNLIVGTPTDVAVVKNLTNAFSGAGGTLMASNPAAVVSIQQGTATGVNGSRGNLDLSGLDTFIANVRAIGLGSTVFPNPGNANQREAGSLILAKTNFITLALTDTLANYQTAGRTNAIELSRNPGNNSAILSQLVLGQSNVFNVDSMAFGRDKASASSAGIMVFNPAFTNNNPAAVFRGAAGGSSRVTWWAMGDMNANASSAQLSLGTNDFSNGMVDALVDTMSLGRDCSPTHTSSGFNVGVLTFTAGTIDVNNLLAGNQALGPNTSLAGNLGIVNVNGAAAKLVVNNTLELGHTTVAFVPGNGGSGTNAAKTFGILNIRNGGTVLANRIIVGAASTNNNSITMNSGTLIVSNTITTNSTGLVTLALTNATLGLTLPANGSLRSLVKNLITSGVTNLIMLDAAPVFFGSYPQQFPLIKYTTWTGTNNFGLTNLPAWAAGATLVSNGPNSSLDLSLPSDPRPVITAQPTAYSGSPGDNVTASFAVTIAPASVTPLGYQWYYTNGVSTNALADGPGPSGLSTLSGSTTANLQIANAQPGDSGGYFVVVTNDYGTSTSSRVLLTISAGAIAPTASGPASQTATNALTTAIADAVSGSPVPMLFWYFNGAPIADGTGPSGSSTISGSSSSTLTISNPQYPGDQGTYSLIASNSAGMATNDTVLTVSVPPVITSQPVSVVVTNTQAASFTVAATGVPAPTYQWNKNGSPISSLVNNTATNATFVIASVSPGDTSTNYTVTITNPAGATNSVRVSLTVNSVMTMTAFSPANSATGICYDTTLAVTFNTAPTLRTAGTIKIYNVTNSATPVDTIDMSLGASQARGIGGDTFNSYPVIVSGSTAAIYPHSGVLKSNATYYVTIDDGVFADSAGAYFAGITATNVWQFTTKVGGPVNPTNLVVTADGSGDFKTVQGAVDSVTLNSTTPTLLNIRNGTYKEIINIKSRHNLDLRGQSRSGVVIGYPNNDLLNPGAPLRACFVLNANDCALENLTLTNMTPKGGSQAEAIDVEGTRAVFFNMDLDSYQDTFLVHSAGKLVYFQDCLVQGDTDFNWGYGTAYYTNCEIRALSSGAHVTQPRSPLGSNGFAFVNCRITKGFASGTFDLGRTIGTPSSPSQVLFANCLMDAAATGYASDAGVNMGDYACSNLTATAPASLSFSTHYTSSDSWVVAAQTAQTWLYGWSPALAPNIITNPVSQTVNYGSSTTFSVLATGIPAPTYQWQHAGTNLSSATSAVLTIGSATLGDGGSYAVIVTTPAGSATSTTVTLTVNPPPNTAPTFTAPISGTNITINVGVNLSLTCTATDSDTPVQTLTYSLLTSLSGATFDTNSGVLVWRPTVAQANLSNPVSVSVTDNGIPNLSATNNFTISVNALTQPSVDATAYAAGQFSATINGQIGPDYALQATTNLDGGIWTTVAATNSPATMPVILNDPNAGSQPVQFYRTVTGPPLP